MPNITLRSQVGADGQLHLNIPTALTNSELDVIVWFRPISNSESFDTQETFSKWWTKQLASVPHQNNHSERDLT